MARKKETPVAGTDNPSNMTNEEYAAWRAAQPEPTAPHGTSDNGSRNDQPPLEPPAPPTNGNGKRNGPKAQRSTFYLIIGTTKDGSAMDVLGRYDTGHQARKAKDAMGMAIARAYGTVNVYQCRDKTDD